MTLPGYKEYGGRDAAVRKAHRQRAERALGKPLPPGAAVHHADGSKDEHAPLVICESHAYHMLLHARMRIVRAGGNPNADRWCATCKRVKNAQFFNKSTIGRCRACERARSTLRRRPEATIVRSKRSDCGPLDAE